MSIPDEKISLFVHGGDRMRDVLPQQKLLLELIVMSGDIALSDQVEGTILERTVSECEKRGWIKLTAISNGFKKASITPIGRTISGVSS